MIAVAPALAISSTPSGNGKNASEAATVPFNGSTAFCAPRRHESTRLVCPAPTPMVWPSRAYKIAFDFTCLQTFQANSSARFSSAVGGRFVTTFKSESFNWCRSVSCTSIPPETFLNTHFCGLFVISTKRRFFLAENFSIAALSKAGAAITSRNSLAISSAAAASTGRFTPITPPNADTGSLERALVRFGKCRSRRSSTGIGVLDDRANRFLEFLRQVPRGLQVNDVVIGKLFALYLARVGYSGARGVGIHCCFLVRIFAVTQVGDLA